MFELSLEEGKAILALRSQFATIERGQHLKYAPCVFTEHGAVMLASVLNSAVAIAASLQVVRAFVRLRTMLAEHRDLARRLDELEQKYDHQFKAVFDAIRALMAPPEPPRKRIGFRPRANGN